MSFWQTYYHIVWGTKRRSELISPAVEKELFPYMRSKANEIGITVHALNGWVNHVHLVAEIPPKWAVADVVKRLKGSSSHYINKLDLLDGEQFAWQRGYGVLTCGHRQVAKAVEYVENQKQHHGAGTTNSWLEYTADDPNDERTMGTVSVQEPTVGYLAGSSPF